MEKLSGIYFLKYQIEIRELKNRIIEIKDSIIVFNKD